MANEKERVDFSYLNARPISGLTMFIITLGFIGAAFALACLVNGAFH